MDKIAILAVVCAFIIKGMSGFANTLIFGSVMSFSTSNVSISPVELILGYPSNLYIAYKQRKDIRPHVCGPLSILIILGCVPGALLLKNGNIEVLKLLFGVVVVLISIEMLLRECQSEKRESSKASLAVIGILSGMLCGLFGIGAFLVAYISRTTENQNQFRGNLCFVFLVENTFRILLYAGMGILNLSVFKDAVKLMPFMVVGLAIGLYLSRIASDKLVKKSVIILLMLSGISLILNNLFFTL